MDLFSEESGQPEGDGQHASTRGARGKRKPIRKQKQKAKKKQKKATAA
jgi:hypothetical protein